MQPTDRIINLFEDLYDGSPWIGVNFQESLSDISATTASKRIAPGRNTIWEIVNHIISWRLNVLRRLQGEIMHVPEHNYMLLVKDTSETAWENTLLELKKSQEAWLNFLKEFDETHFEKIYPKNKMTYYEHIHGILQHDAYHLGQIVLLSKLMHT